MKKLNYLFLIAAVGIIGCSNKEIDKDLNTGRINDSTEQTITAVKFETSEEAKPSNDPQDGEWGHLTGKFTVSGDVPEVAKVVINKDQDTCLANGEAPADDDLIVGPNGELKNVFVMMYLKGSDPPAVHPNYANLMNQPVVIDNVKCMFQPHALTLRTNQVLRMKNSDDVGHNCHVQTFNNEKNVNVPAGQHVDVKLTEVDSSPGPVVCDVHAWMDAVILVRDEPYMAVSATDGTFTIENIPAGDWKFQFWHKRGGYMRKLEVEGYDVGRRGEIELTIADGETLDLGNMTIDGDELAED